MRTASEVLRSLEVRVARLESGMTRRAALDLKPVHAVFPQTEGDDKVANQVLNVILQGFGSNLDGSSNFKAKKGYASIERYNRAERETELIPYPDQVVVGGSMVLTYVYDESDFQRVLGTPLVLGGMGYEDLSKTLFSVVKSKLSSVEQDLIEATKLELNYEVRGLDIQDITTELEVVNLSAKKERNTLVVSLLVSVESEIVYSE